MEHLESRAKSLLPAEASPEGTEGVALSVTSVCMQEPIAMFVVPMGPSLPST